MPVPSLIPNQKVFTYPVEQQVLCNRVAHALTNNDGLSVGLPGSINLSLMLQTFAPRNVRSVVLYCLLLVQSQTTLWDSANTLLTPSDQLTN